MSKHRRIFIIGNSGSGKGVLAAGVAKKLGWLYIDADYSLAPSIGRSIVEILGKTGEERFYECLSEILAYQTTKENIVVTTDDSIICHEKCRRLLAAEFTVYLKVSTKVQLDRISHNRPHLPVDNYKAFLEQLHKERDHFYEQVSTLSLNSDENALDEHVLKVISALKG